MLTLTRKVGQKIFIGDDIEIVIREVRGRQVRLGIVAPSGMRVYREELMVQAPAQTDTDGNAEPSASEPAAADDNDGSDRG